MNNVEFRAVLDWWMSSDPFPGFVNKQIIDDWLDREAKARDYPDVATAFHEAPRASEVGNCDVVLER